MVASAWASRCCRSRRWRVTTMRRESSRCAPSSGRCLSHRGHRLARQLSAAQGHRGAADSSRLCSVARPAAKGVVQTGMSELAATPVTALKGSAPPCREARAGRPGNPAGRALPPAAALSGSHAASCPSAPCGPVRTPWWRALSPPPRCSLAAAQPAGAPAGRPRHPVADILPLQPGAKGWPQARHPCCRCYGEVRPAPRPGDLPIPNTAPRTRNAPGAGRADA